MSAIINFTIDGRTFLITESAHQKIKNYTDSIKSKYGNEPDYEKTIACIESRVAALMDEKIQKGVTHITDVDADEIIAILTQSENTNANREYDSFGTQSFGEKGKLYRDTNHKIIGGVCSGIAHWLNLDPSIVRILVAVLALASAGTAMLAYILLWIFLPAKNFEEYRGKKLYRNPDDKMVGGVAGGMAAYFNKNATAVRWIFAIPLIISILKNIDFLGWGTDFGDTFFGGLTGTFFIAYCILWIVLPEARSPRQKMEMYGKTIDGNTIKENVQATMGDLSNRMQSWSNEVKQTGERLGQQVSTFAQNRGPQFGAEFGQAAARGGKGIGYIIAMILKAFFIFVAGTIAVSLFIAFLALTFSGFAWAPVNNFLWTSDNQQMWAWGTLLFFVGAPIIGLLVSLGRVIFKVRTPGNYLNWLFGGLWTVGWVCLIMFITSISKDFKRSQKSDTPVTISQPSNGLMILKVSQPKLMYNNKDYSWANGGNNLDGFDITADTLKIATVGIDVEKSVDSLFHVIIKKQAFGKTDEDAMNRVNKIQYTVNSIDSVLDLANGFAIDKSSKYRFQNVLVQIQVPAGKKIRIDPSVKSKLESTRIRISGYRDFRRGDWSFKNLSKYRSDIEYTMDSTGKLLSDEDKNVEPVQTATDDYRWDDENDTTSQTPAAPVTPIEPNTDTAVYRYDANPAKAPITTDKSKEQLRKELEQKQKELEELKKKLGQ